MGKLRFYKGGSHVQHRKRGGSCRVRGKYKSGNDPADITPADGVVGTTLRFGASRLSVVAAKPGLMCSISARSVLRPAKTMIKQITVALVGLFAATGSLLAQPDGDDAPAGEVGLQTPTVAAPAPTRPPNTEIRGGGPSTPMMPEEAPPTGEFWASGDYQVGWIRGAHLPPLITTSTAGTAITSAGVLGLPSTTVVLGNQDVNNLARSGGRFQLGYHGTGDSTIGVEAGLSFLQEQNTSFLANSNGSTILARPFFDAVTHTQVATRIAFPGVSSGFITVDAPSQGFTSLNLDMSKRFITTENISVEGLAGYRFMNFGDDLLVNSQLTTIGGPFVTGTKIAAVDQFNARNNFNGGEMGFRGKFAFNRLSLDLLGKLAVGEMHQTITALGATSTTVPGQATTTVGGGLLALGSNSRTLTNNDDWVLSTEFGFNFGWRLGDHLLLRAGYTVLWWDGVARAADQVDLAINQNRIPPVVNPPGIARPALHFNNDALTIQALNFGMEYRY